MYHSNVRPSLSISKTCLLSSIAGYEVGKYLLTDVLCYFVLWHTHQYFIFILCYLPMLFITLISYYLFDESTCLRQLYINYCHINTIPNVTITIPTTLIEVIINNNWSQLFLGSSEDDHTILQN